jgi:hypothetical protein
VSYVIIMGSLCEYEKLEGDIHQYTFNDNTREAVDEWVRLMNAVQEAEGLDLSKGTMRIMVIHPEKGMLPLSYAAKTVERWLKTLPHRRPTRLASVYGKNALFSLIEAFTRIMRLQDNVLVRLFPIQQREEALTWLMKEPGGAAARR